MKERYAEMWETRRERYGKTGRIPEGKWLQFRDKIQEKMEKNKRAREKIKDEMKPSPRRTKLLKKLRSTYRHRPVKRGYYRGDQIRPKTFDAKGWKQFWETWKIDRELKGTSKEYNEPWERNRNPKSGRDRVYHEWKALEAHRKKQKRAKARSQSKKKLRKVV